MYCSQCGTQNADTASLCLKCGNSLSGTAMYAGFWRRVGAALIDQAILTGAFFVLIFVLAFSLIDFQSPRSPASHATLVLAAWAATIVGIWLYYALQESGSHQATVGKLACGIKVTGLDGQRISFGRATGRHFAEWITGFTFLIGYVMAAFTRRRQALHDLIAGTLVVPKEAEASRIAGAAPAKPLPALAIAAIVIAAMIVPFGILAGIAIPAYQDYTIRSQVAEGLIIASDFKAAVAEYVAYTDEWAADAETAGMGDWAESVAQQSRYVQSIEIRNGTITITYGENAHDRIRGRRLSLRPFIMDSGEIVWQCGNASLPQDAFPDSLGVLGGGTQSATGETTLFDKDVPASCRSGFMAGDS